MSIHIILGKPGSGKSMYATARVVRELVEGDRNIVTNLPLNPGRLNEYLQEKFPAQDFRVLQRLKMLTDDEMSFFWYFRGPAGGPRPDTPCETVVTRGDEQPPIIPKRLMKPDEVRREFEAQRAWERERGTECSGDRGVAYFLDEAHIAFNARDWAELGRGALHYLSQHRKLGDVVWPVTQSVGNLDKQFRSVSEDFTTLRNEYTAKFGPFKGRGRFVRKTYLAEPSPNAEPFETAAFTLDKAGLASCYDTARGIGVHGSKADIGRRAKGIHIGWVIPAGLLLALSCVGIPWAIAKGASSFLTGGKSTASKKIDDARKSVGGSVAVSAVPVSSGIPVVDDERKREFEGVTVAGVATGNGRAIVRLSDGREIRSDDGLILRITPSFVDLRTGERLWVKHVASSVTPPLSVRALVKAERSEPRAAPAARAEQAGGFPSLREGEGARANTGASESATASLSRSSSDRALEAKRSGLLHSALRVQKRGTD